LVAKESEMGEKIRVAHSGFVDSDILAAFRANYGYKAYFGIAGRVCSGLLKGAAKSGLIEKHSSHGRVSGYSVWYEGSEEAFAALKEEALKRAASDKYW